ncbi:MAG: hypothetical protein U1D30_18115 [Planctomycetota bacterium]
MVRKTVTLFWLIATAGQVSVMGQAPNPELSRFGARYDAFRLLLADKGLALGSLSEFESTPPEQWKDWIVVVLGDMTAWSRLGISEQRLLSAGGGFLFAADDEYPLNLEDRLDLRAGWVEAAPDSAYQGRSACPILTIPPQVRRSSILGPLVEGVDGIVVNRPGWIASDAGDPRGVAWLPKGTRIEGTMVENPPLAVAAWEHSRGRGIVICDSSMFRNEMILELDNLVFARNIIDWLAAKRDVGRTKVLFLEDGRSPTEWVEQAFLTGNFSEPPTLDDLITLANAMAVGLEEENAFNEILAREQSRILPQPMRQSLVLLGTSVLLLLLGWYLVSSRVPREPRAPEVPATLASVLDQRRQVVKELNNFADPSRRLAEEFFNRATGGERWRMERPIVHLLGDSWHRWRVERRILRLWLLAKGGSRRGVRRDRFLELRDQVTALGDMQKQGSLQLLFSEPSATTGAADRGGIKRT